MTLSRRKSLFCLILMLSVSLGCSSSSRHQKQDIPQGDAWEKGADRVDGVQTPALGNRLLQTRNVFREIEAPPLSWTLFVSENQLRLPNGDKIPLVIRDGVIHPMASDRMESPRGTVIRSAYEPLRGIFLETVGERGGPEKRPLFIIADGRISADLVAALSATARMAGFGAPIWIGTDPANQPVGFVLEGPRACPPTLPPVLPPPIAEKDGRNHHRMALGAASVTGQCSATQIEPVFAQWTEALDQCYALAAEDYPELKGRHELANVSLLLNASGTVAATAFEGRWSNHYPTLSRCIQQTLRLRQYPPSEGFCLISRNLIFSFAHHLDVHHGAPPPPPTDFTKRTNWARVHLFRDGARLELGEQKKRGGCPRGPPAFITLRLTKPEAIVGWVDTLIGAGKRKLETLHIRAESGASLSDLLQIAESLIQDGGRTRLRFSVVETE